MCVGVMYSGEYDVCDVALSASHTQSNIANIIFTRVYNTNTPHKKTTRHVYFLSSFIFYHLIYNLIMFILYHLLRETQSFQTG